MGLLMVGVKASARFNATIVFIKLAAIFLFVGVAFFHIHWENWKPFMPFGWTGVMHGAALIFFAYIGFDAVSTAAEEVKNPQRDMPQGILYSLLICTGIYILVAALLTLIAPYSHLNTPSPVSDVLLHLGYRLVASAVAVGALAGLTTVIFVMFYGLSRISFAMSRDTLLPSFFSFVNSVTKTPIRTLFFSGITMALLAGLLPLRVAAELVNIGTLAAFLCVNLGVVVLRRTRPSLPRPFKVPLGLVCPSLGIFFCLYLIVSLPSIAILRFVIWMLVGFLFYGYRFTQRTP
jgi:APA family basic amino acid/polyamine antiporter